MVFVQTISIDANYEEFLVKFVSTDKQTHNFLHGVIILQVPKKIQSARKKYLKPDKTKLSAG